METTLGFIIIGFVIIIATILLYSKLDKRSDDKIIEKIAEKFGKIEEKLSKVEEMQEEVIDFKDQDNTDLHKPGRYWFSFNTENVPRTHR